MSDSNTEAKALKKHRKKSRNVDVLATGIITGVAASMIMTMGKGILNSLAKRPLILFGAGIGAGYATYKYRKEIIKVSQAIGDQGKDFVSRQQENIKHLIGEHHSGSEK